MNTHRMARATIVILSISLLTLVACSGQAAEQASSDLDFEPITVDVATHLGPDSWETKPQVAYAEAIEADSGGLITFNFHYSESLVAADEFADALQDGLVDMVPALFPAYTPASFPVANWASRLGMLPEPVAPAGLLAGTAAQMEWTINNASLQEEFNSHGIQLLTGIQFILMFDLLCNAEVRTLDDARGKRVRVAGEAWAAEAENIGMEPVFLTGAEIYEGFQRGIVDCVMVHPTAYMDLGLWDVANHYTAASFTGWNSYYVALSEQFWNDLPAQAQQIFWDNLPVLIEENITGYLKNNHQFVVEGEESRGIKFHDMGDDLAAQIEHFHSQIVDEARTEAPGGVQDPAQEVDRRIELQEKWSEIVEGELNYEAPEPGWAAWVAENPDGEFDLSPWLDRINAEILESARP